MLYLASYNDMIPHMLFLSKKNKKKVEFIWEIISILVVISMILLYMPMFGK